MISEKKGRLITFMGIDGSGKTTLTKILMSLLRSNGIKAKYVWGAYDVIMLRPLVLLLKLFSHGKTIKSSKSAKFQASMRRNPRRGIVGFIYRSLVLFEYQIEILTKIRIPLMNGTNIICDRYVIDTVINLAVNLNYSQEEFAQLYAKLGDMCPKPDITFFVDTPVEVAFSRKDDIPSIDYLRKRRRLYIIAAKKNHAIVLNGAAKLSDLRYQIRDFIDSKSFVK
jgi:thymidylate kinase